MGVPVLLLHGADMTTAGFGPLLPGLAAGRRAVACDMQGHGRTGDVDRALTDEGMADDVAALLDHLGSLQPTLLRDPEGGELLSEAVACGPAPAAAGEPGRLDHPVVGQDGGRAAVACHNRPEPDATSHLPRGSRRPSPVPREHPRSDVPPALPRNSRVLPPENDVQIVFADSTTSAVAPASSSPSPRGIRHVVRGRPRNAMPLLGYGATRATRLVTMACMFFRSGP
jgi:hypothetical protein